MADIPMPWYEERLVVPELGPCWEWAGMKDQDGYGMFGWHSNYAINRAARFILTITTGLEPEQLALHHCDNPPCVRPSHLYAGTTEDNNRDRSVRGRAKGTFKHGEKHWHHRLTDRQVRKIIRMWNKGYRQNVIAKRFGVTQPTVSRIVNGERRAKRTETD